MQRSSIAIILLVLTATVMMAVETTIETFRARSTGSSVKIEWRSASEQGLSSYEIERAGSDNVYRFVTSLPVRGNNQAYTYLDEEAFAKRDRDADIAGVQLTYRLRIVHSDRTVTYSNAVSVTHSVSGIKQTWGMIKEMFR